MSASVNDASAALDLVGLRDEDEKRAGEAFARLWARTRDSVARQLARRGVLGADAEDVSQNAFAELWQFRRSVRATTMGEWYALVRKAVGRELSKLWNGTPPAWETAEPGDIPEHEVPYLDALFVAVETRQSLYDGADRLWLGEVRGGVAPEIRAAALQLLLVDGVPKDDVALMFGVDPQEVEGWLQESAVLGRALFYGLCWPNDDLAGYLLRPERPLTSDELDALMVEPTESTPPADWPPQEARIVCWRVRNGLMEKQILQAAQGTLAPVALDGVLEKIRHALPFSGIARTLQKALEGQGRSEAMTRSGLWMRIAFEYATRYELPHRQIVERAGPPANEARFRLDAATLNNWLSMGRIYSQLAAYLQEVEA